MKRVTRVQCSWIFTFTIFGNLIFSVRYPFSTKWLPRDHHAGVLRQEFCISGLKYTVKNKKWKEKVQKNAQLSFCGGREAFIKKSSFEEFNLVFFTAEPMFWNATKSAKFLLNFQVHFALYGRDNYVFEREFMHF